MRYGFFELQGRSGRYRVLEELGRDDTASFHLASIDGRSFVVVRRQLEDRAGDPGARNAFRRAQQVALRQPQHPNVTVTLDAGDREGEPLFVVEEFLPGETFDALRQAAEFGRPIPWQAAAAAVAGAAHAFDALYVQLRPEIPGNAGLGLAPEAITVSYDGLVKVTDPAAELRGRRMAGPSAFGYGTPEYWNQGIRDERGLVFALATLLWELCTGYRLFQAENERDARALFHSPSIDPLGPSFPGFPAALDQLMQQAFSLDPRGRPARPRDFGQRIDALVPDGKSQLARHMANHFAKGRQTWSERLSDHAQEFQGGGPARVESIHPGAPPAPPRPSYDDDDDDARTGFFDASAQQQIPSPYGSPLGNGPKAPSNFGDDDEKTGFFDAAANAGKAPAFPPRPAAKPTSNFGDDDEKTGFFDPSANAANAAKFGPPPRASDFRAPAVAPAGFGDDDEKTGFFDPSARVAAPAPAPRPIQQRTAPMAAIAAQSVDARPPPASRPPPQAPSARVLVDDNDGTAPRVETGAAPAPPPPGFPNPSLQQTGFAPRSAAPAPQPPPATADGEIPFYQPANVAAFPGAPPGFAPGGFAPHPPAPAFAPPPPPPGFAPPAYAQDPNGYAPHPPVPGAFPPPPGFPGALPPGVPAPVPMTGPSAATALVPAATDPAKKKRELIIFALVAIVAVLGLLTFVRRRQAAEAEAVALKKTAELQASALAASASAARAAQVPVPMPSSVPLPTETASAAPTETAAPTVDPAPTTTAAPTAEPTPTAKNPTLTPTPTGKNPTPTPTPTGKNPTPTPTPTATPTPKVSGTGFISVLTNPACDSATFDGRALGACPIFKKSVPAGSHTVKIKSGGSTRAVSVTVEAGQVAIVR